MKNLTKIKKKIKNNKILKDIILIINYQVM